MSARPGTSAAPDATAKAIALRSAGGVTVGASDWLVCLVVVGVGFIMFARERLSPNMESWMCNKPVKGPRNPFPAQEYAPHEVPKE